jgi:hypothetical protein
MKLNLRYWPILEYQIMRLQICFKKSRSTNSRSNWSFICGHTEDGNTETENLTNTFILKTIIMEHKISVVIITLNEEIIIECLSRLSLLMK